MSKEGDGNPNLVVNFVVLFLEHLLMLPPGLTEIKGSLTRDFRLQVFFMNQCPPGPQVLHWSLLNFFENSRSIRELIFITGVVDTGDKLFSGVNDTGEKIRNGPNGILRGPRDTEL